MKIQSRASGVHANITNNVIEGYTIVVAASDPVHMTRQLCVRFSVLPLCPEEGLSGDTAYSEQCA